MKKFLLVAVFLLLLIALPAVGLGIVFPVHRVFAFFIIGPIVFICVLAILLGMRSQLRLGKKTGPQFEGKIVATKLALDSQQLISLYEEIRSHQVTSGGEIIHSIDGSAIISRDLLMVLSHMKTFNKRVSQVAETVRSIDQSLDLLNQGVRTVAGTSEQTATSVEQMSASIDLISQISATRYRELKDVVDMAQRGQGEMSATVNVIREVTGGIGDLQGFIEVIDDIAGRTSILSMNAAIQAAHAGESGRGFAVVADEIRKLANSSAKNASNIAQRLKDLIEDIRKAETSSNATSKFFSTTKESAERLSDSFSEIERGTQELAISGRNILSSVIALRENSGIIRTSSAQVVQTSEGLKSNVDKSQSDSQSLLDQIDNVRKVAAEINFNGLTVAQNNLSGLKLLIKESTQTSIDSDMQKVNLLLQHKSLLARVRAALDGKMKLDPQVISDAQACELGHWLATGGQDKESLRIGHEKLHRLAGSTVTHILEGRITEAEENFSQLLEISQSFVDLINNAFS